MDTSKQDIDIYALLGQSNMDGTGSIEEFDNTPDERILRVTRKNTLEVATEPLNEGKRRENEPLCVGPGLPFARHLIQHFPGRKIALLHRGAGGTRLAQWVKGGESYAISLKLLLAAKELGTIRGVLWHQGEGECADLSLAESYGERFALLANGLRDDLGIPDLPIVAGQIGPFLETNDKHPYAGIVNQQILDLENSIDHLVSISSAGTTHIGDNLHFDTRSQLLMGERFAEGMLKLAKGNS